MTSDSEDEIVAAIIIVKLCRKNLKSKAVWTKNWLRKRKTFGIYDCLLCEFRLESEADYFNFLRMNPQIFDHLLELVKDNIKQDTMM